MPTITSKNPISALRAADVFGADQATNANVTAKVSSEQVREYTSVGYGSTLPIFNRKLAGVATGLNNCRMLIIGDSTSVAYHAGATTIQDAAASWGAVLSRYINESGITAQRDTIFAQGDGTNYLEDARITKGSSWTGGGNTLGGINYTASTTTNELVFAPTGIVDSFKITYLTVASAGTFSANIDGGSNTNTATAGANGLASVTITAAAPGIHTCHISYVSGGAVRIAGIEAWNSKISQVQVMVAGWGGATTANVSDATQPYSPLGGLGFCAPDITFIATGINDWVNAVNTATFTTNYQTLITQAKVSGDCVIVTPPPSAIGQIPQATQDIYIAIIRTLAITNNVPIIDIYDRFQNTVFSSGLYFDNLHPNGLGQNVWGMAAYSFLNLSGSGSYTPMFGIPLLIQTVANNTYTYIGYAGCPYTILGIYQEARALTTAGTFAITINGTNITGLSAVVPSTAGSYTAATALNTGVRGDKIQIIYTSTSLVLDHTLTLDIVQTI